MKITSVYVSEIRFVDSYGPVSISYLQKDKNSLIETISLMKETEWIQIIILYDNEFKKELIRKREKELFNRIENMFGTYKEFIQLKEKEIREFLKTNTLENNKKVNELVEELYKLKDIYDDSLDFISIDTNTSYDNQIKNEPDELIFDHDIIYYKDIYDNKITLYFKSYPFYNENSNDETDKTNDNKKNEYEEIYEEYLTKKDVIKLLEKDIPEFNCEIPNRIKIGNIKFNEGIAFIGL